MLAELVRTQTPDGIRLDGTLIRPNQPASPFGGCALICLHGVGSNFYGSFFLDQVAPKLVEAGLTVLLANTRGRDTAYTTYTRSGARRQGAAFETVHDCLHDLRGWSAYLSEQGFSRVGVFGHSLGAIKAVYATAASKEPSWQWVIAASPPRLCYSLFLDGPQAEGFQQTIRNAERLAAAGRGDELLEVTFPVPMLISAATYVDKYGPQERYDILKHAGKLPVPTLFTYGGKELAEGGVAFAGLDRAIGRVSVPGPASGCPGSPGWASEATAPQVRVIPEADHFYTMRSEQLVREALQWLREIHEGV